MKEYPEVFVIGQGVWSPWYVGKTMTDLDKIFKKSRIIDTPVSEAVTTGAALGASLSGMKPIVVHPRMDFMLYCVDQIVNQAAKWSHMFGGECNSPCLTIRSIINRGGEQGAQHSQALHSWFAHIPGLRVVMPSTVEDARDLLISSVLSPDPVIYIDDRWLYSQEELVSPIEIKDLSQEVPKVLHEGTDLTVVASGYTTALALKAINTYKKIDSSSSIELIDLRVLNPIRPEIIYDSVRKTGRLICIDGGWSSCGIPSEIIALVCEKQSSLLKRNPKRLCLPNCSAPTSKTLENAYYMDEKNVLSCFDEILQECN